jgi:hypothetical protein
MYQSKPFMPKASSQSTGNFSFLQIQVAHWQKLTPLIQAYLPPQGQWHVVCYQHGVLTIAGDNQALISQIRYLQHQYTNNLQAIPALADLERIKVVLQPLRTDPTSQKYTRKKRLSTATQQQLQEAATLVQDAKLSEALQRLASSNNIKDNQTTCKFSQE